MKLENFFNPQSIAVIGASSDKKKVGFALVSNLKNGKKRKIFPISLSEKKILGLKTFKSILDINEQIDLAVIAVKSDFVYQILSECNQKKIKSVIIISAGFKEIGNAGLEMENKISDFAKENDIQILGPNCLGTISTMDDFNASFATGNPPVGSVAFLSQSGALGTALLDMAVSEGVGFSKFISLGNEADLTEIEFLKFLAEDSETKSILIYLEKLSNGSEFMQLAKEITKTKPIVVLKAGRSQAGAKAVSSHTGSLAPDDTIFESACKQAGVITVNSIREFFNMAKLFQMAIYKPLPKICILTNGGGPSVVATDLVDLSKSLSLSQISEETKENLRKVLPSMAAVGNPIDIIGDALSDRFENALEILVKEKGIDAILLLVTPQMMTEMQKTAQLVKKYSTKKKIIPVFLGGPHNAKALNFLKQNNLVNFTFPIDALSALDSLCLGEPKVYQNILSKSSDTTVLQMMDFQKMQNLLAEYDIEISGVFVKDRFDMLPLLKKLRFDNFAMKLISKDLVHKTEAGAVVLNLKNADQAEKALDQILEKNPNIKIDGVHILPMANGREVIIGMKRDKTFGPVILFGLGGILAEAIKDTTVRVAPIEKDEALKMMREIRGIKILDGTRGQKTIDFDSLANIIVSLSRLAIDHPEIKEIDINPVIVTDTTTSIVDVRMMI